MPKNVEEKKKRGRKPKIQSSNPPIVVEKKKRGRKPKSDLSTVPIKSSKDNKKEKSYGNIQCNEKDFSSENIILHLPVHSDDIIDNSLNNQTNELNSNSNIPKEIETTGLKNMNLKWLESKNPVDVNTEFSYYPFKYDENTNISQNNNSINQQNQNFDINSNIGIPSYKKTFLTKMIIFNNSS